MELDHLKSQAWKWFISLCLPVVVEQNSVIWPQVNFQGRLGNVVFLCAQEEGNSMVHTHPGLIPLPCNHLGGYCKGSEQAVVSWAGRVAAAGEI